MTLTVEISPETHQRIADDPEAMAYVAKMIEDAYGKPDKEEDYKLTDADIEALRAGAADIEAGRVHDGRDTIAAMRQKLQERRVRAEAA